MWRHYPRNARYSDAVKRQRATGFLALTLVLLSGCSPQSVAETVSTAQVCAESAVILGQMREVVVLTATNPAGFETYATKLGELLDEACLELGLIVRPLINMCVFSPPLIITKVEIDLMFDIIEKALDKVTKL